MTQSTWQKKDLPLTCQRRPRKCQKRPSKCQKRPSKEAKKTWWFRSVQVPRKCQKRPRKCRKRPSKNTWALTFLYIDIAFCSKRNDNALAPGIVVPIVGSGNASGISASSTANTWTQCVIMMSSSNFSMNIIMSIGLQEFWVSIQELSNYFSYLDPIEHDVVVKEILHDLDPQKSRLKRWQSILVHVPEPRCDVLQ